MVLQRVVHAAENRPMTPNLRGFGHDWLRVVQQPPPIGVVDELLELHVLRAIRPCLQDELVGERGIGLYGLAMKSLCCHHTRLGNSAAVALHRVVDGDCMAVNAPPVIAAAGPSQAGSSIRLLL